MLRAVGRLLQTELVKPVQYTQVTRSQEKELEQRGSRSPGVYSDLLRHMCSVSWRSLSSFVCLICRRSCSSCKTSFSLKAACRLSLQTRRQIRIQWVLNSLFVEYQIHNVPLLHFERIQRVKVNSNDPPGFL